MLKRNNNYLKKFLKIFPGLSLLPILVGVVGVGVDGVGVGGVAGVTTVTGNDAPTGGFFEITLNIQFVFYSKKIYLR